MSKRKMYSVREVSSGLDYGTIALFIGHCEVFLALVMDTSHPSPAQGLKLGT